MVSESTEDFIKNVGSNFMSSVNSKFSQFLLDSQSEPSWPDSRSKRRTEFVDWFKRQCHIAACKITPTKLIMECFEIDVNDDLVAFWKKHVK